MHTAAMTPEIVDACSLIFGPELEKKMNRLTRIRPTDVRDAFRKRALETHPDRAMTLGKDPSILNERFKRITLAYSELNAFIEKGKGLQGFRVQKTRSQKTNCALYIPKRKLLIGQFLYYNKLISWDTHIKAIVWQRGRRPPIGRIAARKGLLPKGVISKLLSLRQNGERFGECAVRYGKLSPRDVEQLVCHQMAMQPKIGEYFVSKGYVSSQKLAQLIQELKRHNLKLQYPNRSN